MDDPHRRFAVELNNETWRVIAAGGPGEDATDAERERFLYGAYASAYHWMETPSATPANRVRAEHLVARANVAAGSHDAAIGHARRCLQLCELNPDAVEDWDLAFAHEAMARALAAAGDLAAAREHHSRAAALGAAIADGEDRAVFLEELAREPWFGLDRSET